MMARAYEQSLESQLALDRLVTTAMRHVRMASDHVDHLRDMVVQRERRLREVKRSPEYQKGIEELAETLCSTQRPVWNGEYVAPEEFTCWARATKAVREQQRETYAMFEASMENQGVIELLLIIAGGEDAGISSGHRKATHPSSRPREWFRTSKETNHSSSLIQKFRGERTAASIHRHRCQRWRRCRPSSLTLETPVGKSMS